MMARGTERKAVREKGRASRRNAENDALFQFDDVGRVQRRDASPIKARTSSQERYIGAIKNFTLTFATGPAGTGKTWLAAALAAEALEAKRIDKIVITRPAVEAGEEMGFLPGDLEEKFDPYLQPFKEVLLERLGKGAFEYHLRVGNIEAAPLAYMRGRTFRNAFVILDEAQNTTVTQMKMFLTRIGEDCTVIVNGDIKQKDIRGESGLADAIKRVQHIPAVKTVAFSRVDVVRSGLVQEIVEAYEGGED
ncbi:PhoH family protein [Burkholderia gladioli]|uniref:PhoH family protein n=1 Tax=Burkholderia gladioli TaxID=28095 RepID=UPI003B5034D5